MLCCFILLYDIAVRMLRWFGFAYDAHLYTFSVFLLVMVNQISCFKVLFCHWEVFSYLIIMG